MRCLLASSARSNPGGAAVHQLVSVPDDARGQRTMAARLKMKKFDIAALEQAHRG